MKYVFLLNSFTLKNKVKEIEEKIKEYCKKSKIDYIIEVNSVDCSTEDILKKYKDDNYVIFPIGGDGIINRTLNSIVNTNNKLGFVPYGTGNDFYRTVLEQFKDGINKCDIIKVNDKYFINTLCFGIDADIANNKNMFKSKFIPKKQSYNLGLLYTFFKYKKKYFEVISDEEYINGDFTTIAICNGCYYGGGYNISPNSNLNDGKFVLLLAPLTNKLSMIKLILSMKNGNHLDNKNIKILNLDKVTIKSDKVCVANIDGEEISSKKFNIEVIKDGIDVCYNKKLIKTLKN